MHTAISSVIVESSGTTSAEVQGRRKIAKSLAESVILQAMEDLYSNAYRNESVEFFNGGGFSTLSEIAGMSIGEKLKLLRMLKSAIQPYREERRQIA